jgi:hypothetical protein
MSQLGGVAMKAKAAATDWIDQLIVERELDDFV